MIEGAFMPHDHRNTEDYDYLDEEDDDDGHSSMLSNLRRLYQYLLEEVRTLIRTVGREG